MKNSLIQNGLLPSPKKPALSSPDKAKALLGHRLGTSHRKHDQASLLRWILSPGVRAPRTPHSANPQGLEDPLVRKRRIFHITLLLGVIQD